MKIFGIYEVSFGKSKTTFMLTNDMVGFDSTRVKRCFDLKGSILDRVTKVSDERLLNGTGLKVLKDQNIIHLNKIIHNEQQKVVEVDDSVKQTLLLQMEKDT